MAEPATKTKPKDEPTAEQNAIDELTQRLDAMAIENAELRSTLSTATDDPEAKAAREERIAWAQDIADVIAGGKEGGPVSRKDARTAIDVIRDAEMAKIAKRRGLDDAERATMSHGVREHIAALGRSAEGYFEREGIGF